MTRCAQCYHPFGHGEVSVVFEVLGIERHVCLDANAEVIWITTIVWHSFGPDWEDQIPGCEARS